MQRLRLLNVIFLCLSLVFSSTYGLIANAQILVDPNAPKNQQPNVLVTANGTPLVNIQTPSAGGVSRNTYSQFDVDNKGAILNNSRTHTQSQIGGWVEANPWLNQGSAKVILNEINSTNRSYLNGFVEVAGQRAEVIIANPAGISVDGGGFINAHNVTLTTGQYAHDGQLGNLAVNDGRISIQGAGLNTQQSNYTRILAKAVDINAGIWAQDLYIGVGQAEYSASKGSLTQHASQAASGKSDPQFLLDVSQLGGMYAGKITLVGTQAGVGVNNEGYIGASAGNLSLTADGKLLNAGQMHASGDLQVHVGADVQNTEQGTLFAEQDMSIQAENLHNSGALLSGGDAELQAQRAIHNQAQIHSEGHLTLQASQIDNQQDAQVISQGNLSLVATGMLNNAGVMHSDASASVRTGQLNQAENASLSAQNLTITNDKKLNNQGIIAAEQSLSLSSQTLDNSATGGVFAEEHSSLNVKGSLTNRGVLDGGLHHIRAGGVQNIGTGRIYGDSLAIETEHLANISEAHRIKAPYSNSLARLLGITRYVTTSTDSASIAARLSLNIGAIDITNNGGAYIFSGGDLSIGRELDEDLRAVGRSQSITNNASSIESIGSMSLMVYDLLNQSKVNKGKLIDSKNFVLYQANGQSQMASSTSVDNYTIYKFTRTTTEETLQSIDYGQILAGGDLHLDGKILRNDQAHIIVGGRLTVEGGKLLNLDTNLTTTQQDIGTSQYTYKKYANYYEKFFGSKSRYYDKAQSYKKTYPTTTQRVSTAKLEEHANVALRPVVEVVPELDGLAVRTIAPNTTLPTASLYSKHPEPEARYLIETDPRFANYKDWLSSDYMLEKLKIKDGDVWKKLGDGFYEQRLIREQISQLTGMYFLGDYSSEEEQYLALMNAGINFALEHQLIPGVALTAEQMALLTNDMVWLTLQEVQLPDGSMQKVLAPQLYAQVDRDAANGQGGVISARDVDMQLAGDLDNQAKLLAKRSMDIHAQNIDNQNGLIQAHALRLKAEGDINNLGGTIRVDDSLDMSAKGDILIETTLSQSKGINENGSYLNTVVDRVAGVFVGKHATGNILIDAGRSLSIIGAEIVNASKQVMQLIAGEDILFTPLALDQQEHYVRSANNYSKTGSLTHQGGRIDSQGSLLLQAGNTVALSSAQISSAEDIDVYAKDILITANADRLTQDNKSQRKSTFKKTTTRDGFVEETASSSSLNANNINLNASNKIAVTGSSLSAQQDLTIGSVKVEQQEDGSFKAVNGEGTPENLVVGTLALQNDTWHERTIEKRGLAKAASQAVAVTSASLGISSGKQTLSTSTSEKTFSTTHVGSDLNAGNNLVLAAKDSVHVTSGNINAGATATATGKDVAFDVAVNTQITETTHSKTTVAGTGAALGKDEITLGGLQTTKQTDTTLTTKTTHQGTTINAGNLVVLADNDASFIASDVTVANDAIVQAGNDLIIEGRADSVTVETTSKTDTTTVSLGVKNAYVDTALAADALVKAGDDVKRAESALRDAERRVKDGTLAASALDDYKLNLAAATTQLTQATLNVAASGATAAASTGTFGFYATGKAEKTTSESHSTDTKQTYQGSNFKVGGNVSLSAGNKMDVVGSGIAVGGGLAMNADQINITAGVEENTSHSSSQTKTASVTASTGASASVGANASRSKNESDSYSKTHANSQISAGSFSSDSKAFTLQGANVEIVGDVQLNTEQLTIASVQDTHQSSSKGSSQSVGVTAGGGSINPSSIGAGKNSSSEDSQWVNNQTTLIGGGNVNITADKTTVTGAVVANATRNNDGSLTDHGNLNLITDELVINDLQDYNRNESKGIDVSAGLSKNGTSSLSLQKGGHNTEQTTYATLGGGTVTKKDGTAHNTENVNRDLSQTQEITKDQQTAGLDATVTVDHRLLTKEGQNAIKEDFTKTGMIVDTVALIATTDRVGITDFFKETGIKHTTYEGIKSEIANNPELAKQLQNPDLTPAQKEAMLDQLTHRVMDDLGYSKEGYQNLIVANDKDYVQKEDGTYERHGFYSEDTQSSYINDAFIKDTKGLVTTAGHELSHAMDDRSGVSHSEKDNEIYAKQFGNNFGSYTNTALGVTGNGSMASTNNHVGNNSQDVKTQTNAYNQLDKSKGDDLTIFVHGTFSNPKSADADFLRVVGESFEEPVFQFDWSGINGNAGSSMDDKAENERTARINAGGRLSDFIETYKFEDGESLNIIAHSHGGNVVKEFTQMYDGDKKVDSIYFLGTPHRSSHILNPDVLSKGSYKVNVYDNSDLVQLLGMGFDSGSKDLRGFSHMKIEVKNNRYIPIFTPLFDDHSDLDSADVWQRIKSNGGR